jgi:hypothetical protein
MEQRVTIPLAILCTPWLQIDIHPIDFYHPISKVEAQALLGGFDVHLQPLLFSLFNPPLDQPPTKPLPLKLGPHIQLLQI